MHVPRASRALRARTGRATRRSATQRIANPHVLRRRPSLPSSQLCAWSSPGRSVNEGGAIDEKRAYREVHAINKRYKEAFSIATELRVLPGTTVTVDGEPSDLAVDGGVPTDEVMGTDERSSKLGAAVELLAENIDNWREIQQFVNGKRQLATYESEVASVMAHSRALLGLAMAGSDNDSWRKQATDELDKVTAFHTACSVRCSHTSFARYLYFVSAAQSPRPPSASRRAPCCGGGTYPYVVPMWRRSGSSATRRSSSSTGTPPPRLRRPVLERTVGTAAPLWAST